MIFYKNVIFIDFQINSGPTFPVKNTRTNYQNHYKNIYNIFVI
jgi:hypothetical protein